MKFLIVSVLFLAVSIARYYLTRQSILIVLIGLGAIMTSLGVIGLWWHPTP